MGWGSLISLGPCADLPLCPARALHQSFVVQGQRDGSFFIYQDGFPLSKFQFWNVTRKALDKLGFSSWQFGMHSFQNCVVLMVTPMGYLQGDIQQIGLHTTKAM